MSGRIPKRIQTTRKFKKIGAGVTKTGTGRRIGQPINVKRSVSMRSNNKQFLMPTKTETKLYNVPNFNELLTDNLLTSTHRTMIQSFMTYSFVNTKEEYQYGENTNYAIINIRQSHFDNGTLRITKPGIYVLKEDIVFHPNPTNDFQPTGQQIGTGQYPMNNYFLGFFAAITVESDNVILDLNGHTIKQSLEHYLEQRFYANIELASAPFIGPQGPGVALGENGYYSGDNILIMNGTLGLSSHHGIHSNLNDRVLLHNLDINDFQVGGIALNGLSNSVFNYVNIHDSNNSINATSAPVLFSYSQTRFVRNALNTFTISHPSATLNIHGIPKTIDIIKTELDTALFETKTQFLQNNDLNDITSELFKNTNTNGLSDGNMYGIVLNVTGVVVNDFLTERPETVFPQALSPGNENIHLRHVIIENITSEPRETVGLKHTEENDTGSSGYGDENIMKGPFGDVFDINFNTDETNNNVYKENVLANAQAIIAQIKLNDPNVTGSGSAFIVQSVLDWIKDGTNLNDVMGVVDNYLTFVEGIDGMAHFMKGNIGLFISGARNITSRNIVIDGVSNIGTTHFTNTPAQGKASYGIVQTAWEQPLLNSDTFTVSNINSENGEETINNNIINPDP